jgi:hypothetical protein
VHLKCKEDNETVRREEKENERRGRRGRREREREKERERERERESSTYSIRFSRDNQKRIRPLKTTHIFIFNINCTKFDSESYKN